MVNGWVCLLAPFGLGMGRAKFLVLGSIPTLRLMWVGKLRPIMPDEKTGPERQDIDAKSRREKRTSEARRMQKMQAQILWSIG